MRVRPARVDEVDHLTELALRSKAHWGYDDAFMAACRDELTMRAEWVDRIDVAEDDDGVVVGMVRLEPEAIEDLFVEPAAIGSGVGRLLFVHAVRRAALEGMRMLNIDADPNARGFYEAMGAVLVGESPSGSIPGRVLPRYELSVPKAVVRYGYDDITEVYGSEVEHGAEYAGWLDLVAPQPGERVLDIGCARGVPMARLLVDRGCDVVGIDISDEQVAGARQNVPEATFERADVTAWDAPDDSFDVIVAMYSLIHVPVVELEALVPRLARWLRPGGRLLAIVGAHDWLGVEEWHGTTMFWEVNDPTQTIGWLEAAGFDVVHRELVPEGTSGHELLVSVLRGS